MKRFFIFAAIAAISISGWAQTAFDSGAADSPTNDMAVAFRAIYSGQKDDLIVDAIYGETTNSSFIVRKELTATQKRFLALGRRLFALCVYTHTLERRIETLERERKQGLKADSGHLNVLAEKMPTEKSNALKQGKSR